MLYCSQKGTVPHTGLMYDFIKFHTLGHIKFTDFFYSVCIDIGVGIEIKVSSLKTKLIQTFGSLVFFVCLVWLSWNCVIYTCQSCELYYINQIGAKWSKEKKIFKKDLAND